MANTRTSTVVIVDTTADFPTVKHIKSVKYIGNTSGTAVIKADDSSGDTVWEESGTSNVYNSQVCMYNTGGFRVEVTNGAVVYLYIG